MTAGSALAAGIVLSLVAGLLNGSWNLPVNGGAPWRLRVTPHDPARQRPAPPGADPGPVWAWESFWMVYR